MKTILELQDRGTCFELAPTRFEIDKKLFTTLTGISSGILTITQIKNGFSVRSRRKLLPVKPRHGTLHLVRGGYYHLQVGKFSALELCVIEFEEITGIVLEGYGPWKIAIIPLYSGIKVILI